MSKEKSSSNFGVMIIVLGIGILLYNLNILKITMFWGIIKLWPLLLIVMGLSIIFKRVRYISLVLWLLFIGMVMSYSYINMDEMTWSFGEDIPSIEYEASTRDMQEGLLDININTGEVIIDGDNIEKITYAIPEKTIKQASFEKVDETSVLKILSEKNNTMDAFSSKKFDVSLPQESSWYIEIDGGVMSLDMDLSKINTIGGNIDFGIGDAKIILSSGATGYYEIDLGIGEVVMTIPETIGVKLISDSGIGSTDLPDYRKESGVYYSKNYETSKTQIEINVDLGIGSLEIK